MILHPRRCDSGRLLTYVHLLTTADQLCREYSSVSSGLSYTWIAVLEGVLMLRLVLLSSAFVDLFLKRLHRHVQKKTLAGRVPRETAWA